MPIGGGRMCSVAARRFHIQAANTDTNHDTTNNSHNEEECQNLGRTQPCLGDFPIEINDRIFRDPLSYFSLQ